MHLDHGWDVSTLLSRSGALGGSTPTSLAYPNGVGLGLIIEWPSGVLFSNQTGGTSTLHPELEGVFLPIRNDCEREGNRLLSPEGELLDYFEGPKHQGTGATQGLDAEDADFIGSVLLKWRLKQITVDRRTLGEAS